MAVVKPAKPAKVELPNIPWAEDDDKLVWSFITELKKDENYKILFGKKRCQRGASCHIYVIHSFLTL